MADEGGDAACWLDRVCDVCGRVVDDRDEHVCSVDAPASTEGAPATKG